MTELKALMERALDGVEAPAGLYDEAVAAGSRLRRRRRAGTALAGLAAAAAAAAIVVPLAGGGTSTATEAPITSTGPLPSAAATPDRETTPFVSHPGWWDMPVPAMRERLAALLPDDVSIRDVERQATDRAPGEPARRRGHFIGTLADGDGRLGSIEIILTELPQDPGAREAELRRLLACSASICRRLADQRSLEAETDGVTYRESVRRAGDGAIFVAVANSTSYKWGPPATAPRPPLLLSEVERIAASESWTEWSSAAH